MSVVQSRIRDTAGGLKKSLAFKYVVLSGLLTTLTISILTLFFVLSSERSLYNSVEKLSGKYSRSKK